MSIIFWLLFELPQVFTADNASSPRIVVSIKPLHSIIAGVMLDFSTPYLIVNGNSSPHTYTLKPSAALALQKAQVVFWAGDNVETFLIKPLVSLSRQAQIVAMSTISSIQLWSVRSSEKWKYDHEDEGHANHENVLLNIDPHVWLDPVNVKIMVKNLLFGLIRP